MSSNKKTDLNMQNVPLSAVKDPEENNHEKEMLPNDPSSNMEKLEEETGQSPDALMEEEENPASIVKYERSTGGIIAEAIFIPILIIFPALLTSLCFVYDSYSLNLVKGPLGLNTPREFERWSYFLAVSYFVWVVSELFFRFLPNIILRICQILTVKLSRHERTAILCLRYAERYLGMAFSLLFIFNYAEYILYESSTEAAAREIVSRLSWNERVKAYELILGDRIESTIAALFIIAVVVAIEKYLIAAIHASFHRVALAPRIAKCNEKFAILGVLSRARQANRATISTASLAGGEEEEQELSDDRGIDLSSSARARASAKEIFKALCPADRGHLTAADFRPYFSLNEYEKAFQVFDVNRKSYLDRSDFKKAVIDIYDERFRTAKALIVNGHIVRKLDWILLSIFLFFGVLVAFVIFNHNGYSWVTSMGSFILGFSFLFQTTMARVLDTFLFVFVEHAYDVGDNTVVDSDQLLVSEIEILTTIFTRNDGLLMYSPNSSLKGKSIYNRQRSRSEIDEIMFLVDAKTDVTKLVKLRTKLTDYLTETVNEFTGTVSVGVVSFEGTGFSRQARIKVEPKYRPRDDDLRSDLTLHNRRAELLARFNDACSDLSIRPTMAGRMSNWDVFQGRESENNWLKRDEQIQVLMKLIEQRDDTSISTVLAGLRIHYHDILAVLHTPRTQLALAACKLVKLMAMAFSAEEYDCFSDAIISNLIRLCASTKKLIAASGESALEQTFLKAAPFRVINALGYGMLEKNAALRQRVLDAWLAILRQTPDRWFPRFWADLEPVLSKSVGDASPAVRASAVQILTIAEKYCSQEIAKMIYNLDHSTGKQLRQLLAKQNSALNEDRKENANPVETMRLAKSPKPAETMRMIESPKPVEIMMRLAENPKPAETMRMIENPRLAENANPFESPRLVENVNLFKSPRPVKVMDSPENVTFSANSVEPKLIPISPNRLNFMEETSSQSTLDDTDDEVIIPMQRISINGSNENLGSHVVPPIDAAGNRKLVFSTPFRRFVNHQNAPVSPVSPSRISVDSLFDQLSEYHVPIATWKKLAIIAESKHPHLTPAKITSLFEIIEEKLIDLPILKNSDECLEFTNEICRIILFLEDRFPEMILLWRDSPLTWTSVTKERIEFLLNFASENSGSLSVDMMDRQDICYSSAALEYLQSAISLNGTEKETLASCLPTLNQVCGPVFNSIVVDLDVF